MLVFCWAFRRCNQKLFAKKKKNQKTGRSHGSYSKLQKWSFSIVQDDLTCKTFLLQSLIFRFMTKASFFDDTTMYFEYGNFHIISHDHKNESF